MPNIPCPVSIRCPGTDDPVSNYSSEAVDGVDFLGLSWPVWPLPKGPYGDPQQFTADSCMGIITAPTQEEADLIAALAAYICSKGGGGTTGDTPPLAPAFVTIPFTNGPQTCSFTCPDGSLNSYSVPGGWFGGSSQAQADFKAHQYACQKAAQNHLCISKFSGFACANPNHDGDPYSFQLEASSMTPITAWALTSGSLPPGINMDVTGLLTGFPEAPGDYTFTAQATNAAGMVGSRSMTFSVLGINVPSDLGVVDVCDNFSLPLNADGGTPPYTFSENIDFPDWLSISDAGVLSGTPLAIDEDADYQFTVTVTDSLLRACSKTFNITVPHCPTMTIVPSPVANGIVGEAYIQILGVTGGTAPYTWVEGSPLPTGLTLSAAGIITGTPQNVGTYNFDVLVTDDCGCSVLQTLAMTIGTIGNDLWTIACPTNPLITASVAKNTYVNQGAYAGFNKQQLNNVASTAAINSLNGQGCPNCNFTLDVDPTTGQNAHSTCLVQCHVDGSGTGAGLVNINGTVNLKFVVDILTGFSSHGTYNWYFVGQTPPPYAWTTWYP